MFEAPSCRVSAHKIKGNGLRGCPETGSQAIWKPLPHASKEIIMRQKRRSQQMRLLRHDTMPMRQLTHAKAPDVSYCPPSSQCLLSFFPNQASCTPSEWAQPLSGSCLSLQDPLVRVVAPLFRSMGCDRSACCPPSWRPNHQPEYS